MISPLRRKRRTTAPITPRSDPHRAATGRSSAAAALLALPLLAGLACAAVSPAPLAAREPVNALRDGGSWGNGRSGEPTAGARFPQAASSAPLEPAPTGPELERRMNRFQSWRPNSAPRADHPVRPAAFQGDSAQETGPALQPAPLPVPRGAEEAGNADRGQPPCDRVHNRTRDCCAEDRECAEAHRKLRDRPITAIRLDLSPSLGAPGGAPAQRAAVERKLAAIPSRAWYSCTGEFLAEGRLVDYRRGMVHILENDGAVLPFPTRELGADELCFVTAWWELPAECPLWQEDCVPLHGGNRHWAGGVFHWKPSGLAHRPLYFEQVQLERYGQTAGPLAQPVISGAHFFLNVAMLPYKMGMYPPTECQFALGYYRPGACAPRQMDPLALSLRGALYQAAVVGGGVALLP